MRFFDRGEGSSGSRLSTSTCIAAVACVAFCVVQPQMASLYATMSSSNGFAPHSCPFLYIDIAYEGLAMEFLYDMKEEDLTAHRT